MIEFFFFFMPLGVILLLPKAFSHPTGGLHFTLEDTLACPQDEALFSQEHSLPDLSPLSLSSLTVGLFSRHRILQLTQA